MQLNPNQDVFDLFLATRHGKYVVGILSIAVGVIFLIRSRVMRSSGGTCSKNEGAVKRWETVIQRDALLFFGSVALMLGAIYLFWSIFLNR